MAQVKMHGFWSSPFSFRVTWALKLKGIDYEYLEEDLQNKSEEYNPVHKQIPVLVHNGKPISESLVILEYIEETWPENYPLLPKYPYDRAMARFWIQYGASKIPMLHAFFGANSKEEKEKVAAELLEMLKIIEEKALGDKKFFGGQSINLVDLSFGIFGYWIEAIQEVVGVKVLDETKLPKLYAWTQNFNQVPIIKEDLPDYDKYLVYLRNLQDKFAKE